ncbi:hypothetical protein C1645_822243 [Glomus cerebriforme]|uniref:Uncharacterized protein n=1 Tax=Glomus cerebriforme TaxID=658196 RepID=A0A397T577_9GLOM|nr:hypothetical protein C1645_822243 [Glomus cerebriforme]
MGQGRKIKNSSDSSMNHNRNFNNRVIVSNNSLNSLYYDIDVNLDNSLVSNGKLMIFL